MNWMMLGLALLPLSVAAAPKKHDCSAALDVAHEFTMKAVRKNYKEAYAFVDQTQWTSEGFEKAVDQQFRTLLGKEANSYPAFNHQERNTCNIHPKTKKLRVSLNRLLLNFEGGPWMAKVLSIGLHLQQEKDGKWVVTSFASTAM